MTREEAKKRIYEQWQEFLENNIDYAGISEAYKMAIKALEQLDTFEYWMKKGVFVPASIRQYILELLEKAGE